MKRRPTRAEADDNLLEIAAGLERTADRYEQKTWILNPHNRANHVAYLRAVAATIRSFVKRESQFMPD